MENKIGRNDKKSASIAPNYHPNYEFGRKQLGTSGGARKWKNIPDRKPNQNKSNTNNENYFDFDFYTK